MDIFGLALLILVFYSCWLGSYPVFTPDEGRYSEVAREMVATGNYITPHINGITFLDKPILYYWLQAIAINLFGVKEYALRLFPMLLGVLGCLVTYGCGRRLFNRQTGFLSTLILATTPLYFGGSHYANLDLEVAVFISCTLLFFMTAIQCQDRFRIYFFFAAYLSSALAFLTKGLIGVAFPSMIIGSWMLLLGRLPLLRKIHLGSGVMLFILIVSPWYILVQKANPDFFHYFFVTQQVTRFLSGGVFNNATPFWFYGPIVLLGFFPWTSFLFQALAFSIKNVWQNRHQHQIELFLILWLIIIFVFFSIPHSKTISYIFPICPALALLVGNFLSVFWEKTRQKNIYGGMMFFTLLAILLAILLFSLPYHQWLDLTPAFNPYAISLGIVLLLGIFFTCFTINRSTLRPLFAIFTLLSATFLFILMIGATYLNSNTAKPLVQKLKSIIQPQDEVITYFKYYQDVPLYLSQRVSVVANWGAPDIAYKDNWLRELWNGISSQKAGDWLINESTLLQRWNSKKRVFVFVNDNYLDQFKKQVMTYYQIDRYNDIFLLSNKN